jgi:hypothetical protein
MMIPENLRPVHRKKAEVACIPAIDAAVARQGDGRRL